MFGLDDDGGRFEILSPASRAIRCAWAHAARAFVEPRHPQKRDAVQTDGVATEQRAPPLRALLAPPRRAVCSLPPKLPSDECARAPPSAKRGADRRRTDGAASAELTTVASGILRASARC